MDTGAKQGYDSVMSNNPTHSTFNQVVLRRDELLTAIKENKQIHDGIYADALKGYYGQVKEQAAERIAGLNAFEFYLGALAGKADEAEKEGKAVTIDLRQFHNLFSIHVPFPVSHGEDYDRAIRMVEMSANELFALSQDEFSQYVMNDWDWKQEFLATNALYAKSAESVANIRSFRK